MKQRIISACPPGTVQSGYKCYYIRKDKHRHEVNEWACKTQMTWVEAGSLANCQLQDELFVIDNFLNV